MPTMNANQNTSQPKVKLRIGPFEPVTTPDEQEETTSDEQEETKDTPGEKERTPDAPSHPVTTLEGSEGTNSTPMMQRGIPENSKVQESSVSTPMGERESVPNPKGDEDKAHPSVMQEESVPNSKEDEGKVSTTSNWTNIVTVPCASKEHEYTASAPTNHTCTSATLVVETKTKTDQEEKEGTNSVPQNIPQEREEFAEPDRSAVLDADISEAFEYLRGQISFDQRDVFVHRKAVLPDLLELYRDEEVVKTRLYVNFLGESGDDFGGLTKELLSLFWSEATKKLFVGEHCVVPVLPLHRVRHDSWKFVSLGRILSHTIALNGAIPQNLSKSFLVNMIFGSDIHEECLLKDFLEYVTNREKNLLIKALYEFQSLSEEEMDRLQSFFVMFHYFDNPRGGEIREQILTIAENELLKKPASLCALMKQGIPQSHIQMFWNELTAEHIIHIMNQQRPTPQKVINVIVTTEEHLTQEEEVSLYYLKEFVGSLHQDSLVDFLLFCTGSVHQPKELGVTFNILCGVKRRPIAHTCSNLLEVPATYSSFQEFKREFLHILSSPLAFQYSEI